MLNTNYCIADKKYQRKHIYLVYFSFKIWRGEKKYGNTANAASIYELVFVELI